MAKEAAKQERSLSALAGKEEAVMRAASSDQTKLLRVIAATDAAEAARDAARAKHETTLKGVTVEKGDISFLWSHFELPIPAADRLLRENGGDLQAVLRKLTAV